MSSRPFFLAPTARKPDTEADDVDGHARRADPQDQWHFFGAYEFVDRSLITGGQVITVDAGRRAGARHHAAAERRHPRASEGQFRIRQDRLSGLARHPAVGPLLSVQEFFAVEYRRRLHDDRSRDRLHRSDGLDLGPGRDDDRVSRCSTSSAFSLRGGTSSARSGSAVDGPAITVSGKAHFGGPRIGDGNSVGFDFNQKSAQVIDNYTWMSGAHAMKTGIDAQFIGDERVAGENFQYTFPTIDAYLAAKSGTNPFGYTTLQQLFGDLTLSTTRASTGCLSRTTGRSRRRIKLLYGVRYDLFDVPERGRSPATRTRRLHDRQEQLRPARRRGLVARFSGAHRAARLDRQDVRAAADRLLRQRDPEQRRSAALQRRSVPGTAAGAPPFPTSLATPPPGFVLPRQSITAVDPDFRTQSAWLSNVQLERALTRTCRCRSAT